MITRIPQVSDNPAVSDVKVDQPFPTKVKDYKPCSQTASNCLLRKTATQGGGIKGAFAPPRLEALPPTCPPVRRKNGQNKPFSANFWIFAPSESHFAPSMPPHKKKKKKSGVATAATTRELKSSPVLYACGLSIECEHHTN